MGLGSRDISVLIELKKAGHIAAGGSVVDLGSQRLGNRFLDARDLLQELAGLFGVTVPHNFPPATFVAGKPAPQSSSSPMAEQFWRWLGYEYSSIDIDGNPGSIPLDLNYDDVPDSEVGRYQIVTNYGTTEHVANQLNAFKVVHDLTAVSGIMLHHVPAQGMLTHGLVNYTHKFFWTLARSNGYEVLRLQFVRSDLSYTLPENVRSDTGPSEFGGELETYQTTDCSLIVVLKKTYDISYVAPIDVNTGARTDNEALKRRYWTVFDTDVFSRIVPNKPRLGLKNDE